MIDFFHVDHFAQSAANLFSASSIDRLSLSRTENWKDRLQDDNIIFVPVYQQQFLFLDIHPAGPLLCKSKEFSEIKEWCSSICLLGEHGGNIYFALGVEEKELIERFATGNSFKWKNLRSVRGTVPTFTASILAYASAMTYWHEMHKFCGKCGNPTKSQRSGHLRVCVNPACKKEHFPRINPAIITLITHGERCLLAHGRNWPEKRYACVAGFMEPGESMEDTVKREVWEETGLELNRISYHSSQPWPFPSGLMLGFHAQARTTKVQFHDGELSHSLWLSRGELKARILANEVILAPPVAISYKLIEAWYNEGVHGESLIDLVGDRPKF